MNGKTYWLDLFSVATWDEFLAAGADVSGFRQSRWKTVQKIKPGDYLLCYLTRASRWVGLLEVVSQPFQDSTPIWKMDPFPSRVKVKPEIMLAPEKGVPVVDMKDRLSVFRNLKNPLLWSGPFRNSPSKWKAADGEAVVDALRQAERNPITRPIDEGKLKERPPTLETKIGPVTVPEPEPSASDVAESVEPTLHAEIQWLLLKLGSDMGLDVWVARNDKGREWKGNRFSALPNLRADLPIQTTTQR